MADTKTAPKKAAKNVWSNEERAAMQASVRERKSSAKLSPEQERAAGEQELRAKLAEMPADDRAMGERIHEVVMAAVPAFVPKTYYGMPAYAKDGRTLCFYKPKSKFKVRYSTFGFQADAMLDDGDMWATEFAVIELTPKVEQRIAELVKKAAG
jgi:uncharacterized protein YdhG (YjbR/CyaY superfamily)